MQLSARSLKVATIAAALAVVASISASADSLNVRLDKAEILRLDYPASIVIVGNPEIADVTVESPSMLFVTGLTAGETNLIILDEGGNELMEYDLVVVAEVDRQVTVHRNVEVLTTFSCKPRCIEVPNPSEIERARQFSETEDEDDDAGASPEESDEEEESAAADDDSPDAG